MAPSTLFALGIVLLSLTARVSSVPLKYELMAATQFVNGEPEYRCCCTTLDNVQYDAETAHMVADVHITSGLDPACENLPAIETISACPPTPCDKYVIERIPVQMTLTTPAFGSVPTLETPRKMMDGTTHAARMLFGTDADSNNRLLFGIGGNFTLDPVEESACILECNSLPLKPVNVLFACIGACANADNVVNVDP